MRQEITHEVNSRKEADAQAALYSLEKSLVLVSFNKGIHS